MQLTIMITGSDGSVKAQASGLGEARLVYTACYEEGDTIHLSSSKDGIIIAQLEDSLSPVYAYLNGEFSMPIPFGERRVCFSPKCFSGEMHLLWARAAVSREQAVFRNLALNPLDHHGNDALYPHAHANVETRGESVFAARNAINGNITATGHGQWPYESWGINRREDAEISIDFGRPICLDALVVILRADFPHDNWWKQATVEFSDGSSQILRFIKGGSPQIFEIHSRIVKKLTMKDLIKDETDPSPFPALVQLECWGHDI